MKKIHLIAYGLMVLTFVASCRKDETNEQSPTLEKIQASPETLAAITTIPSNTTGGMKNYESFYVSKVDGKKHGYIISTPLDYDPNKATLYPLLVFLHGDGEKPNGEYDFNKLKAHGPHKEIFQKSHKFPAIIASFQMEQFGGDFNVKTIKEFIDVLTGELSYQDTPGGSYGFGKYNINLNSVHLTGLSKGGAGVYGVAASYPTLLSSISVFAGFTWGPDDMKKIKIPTYIRHNLFDGVVNVNNAYNAQSWINDSKPSKKVDLNIFNLGGHDAWSSEYARTDGSSVYDFHFNNSKGKPSGNNSNANPTPQPNTPAPPPVVVLPKPSTPPPAATPNTGAPVILSTSPTFGGILGQLLGYQTVSMKFNKKMVKGKGSIKIKNLTDNTSFDVYPNWGMVSVSNEQVNIYPVLIRKGNKYSVQIQAGAFKDEQGNNFAGISNDYTWTFTAK